MTTKSKYTEAQIDLVAKLIADKCGNGMREKYEDVSRQIVELLSERQATAGLGEAGRVSAVSDEREAFENWARGTYSIGRHAGLPDQYAAIGVQCAWMAWKHRAAIAEATSIGRIEL